MTKREARVERLKQIIEYASDTQKLKIQATIECGGVYAQAAIVLGVDESVVRKVCKRVEHVAARMGCAPEAGLNHKAPAGFSIDRVSSFLDEDGKVQRQWVIANRDKENQFEVMMEAWRDVCEAMPKAEITPAPDATMEHLLCDYTIGDNHTGLYAWAREASDNWDLHSSVTILRRAMNHLVHHSPAAETAYILDVGDYFHADSMDNETRGHGHKLDVDGRYGKVLRAGIDCICDLIEMALKKHKKVLYRSVVGNHNDHSAQMMNIAVSLRFYNEPRLEVLDSPAFHHYYQFGTNLLADTHGHTTKAEALPLLMAVDVPEMWAGTTNRVWRTGHVHHLSQKEFGGCTVITYRTLAPKDAWHAAQGYRSNRDMRCTVYHKDRGTVGMNIVNPSMLGSF